MSGPDPIPVGTWIGLGDYAARHTLSPGSVRRLARLHRLAPLAQLPGGTYVLPPDALRLERPSSTPPEPWVAVPRLLHIEPRRVLCAVAHADSHPLFFSFQGTPYAPVSALEALLRAFDAAEARRRIEERDAMLKQRGLSRELLRGLCELTLFDARVERVLTVHYAIQDEQDWHPLQCWALKRELGQHRYNTAHDQGLKQAQGWVKARMMARDAGAAPN